jgi:hypothetical protein
MYKITSYYIINYSRDMNDGHALCSFCYVCSVLCHCVVLCTLCENVYWTTATGISGHFSTTLTEVFLYFFLSYKANASV